MPTRTIAQATEVLADMAPALNPEMYRRYEGQIQERTNAARAKATEIVTERYQETLPVGQEALRDLCSVRDEASRLKAEVVKGRITAREAIERLDALRTRQRSVSVAQAKVARAHDYVVAIEADPVAYADDLYERFPFSKPEFDF